MAEQTKIQWTDHTFNPWRGCAKVAAGCANCYAEATSKRNPGTLGIWGPHGTRVVASESMWRQPAKWNDAAECDCFAAGHVGERHLPSCPQFDRPRVFCASLADVFEDWDGPMVSSGKQPAYLGKDFRASGGENERLVMADVRRRLGRLIKTCLNIDWLVLTKRPENAPAMLAAMGITEMQPNLWLGTSIACRKDLANLDALRKSRDLAPVLFVSIEPLIEDLGPLDLSGIDWVIVGGESGPHARPCNVAWIRSVIEQCQAAGVACFVKQLGANPQHTSDCDWEEFCRPWPDGVYFDCPEDGEDSPLRIILRDPKGGDPAEWPEDLRVRQFPQASSLKPS